jgi:hypothetical protein
VHTRFQNLNIECWEHPAKLGNNGPFLCLCAPESPESTRRPIPDSGKVLLEAVEELMTETPPASRTLTLQSNVRTRPITRIRIMLWPESDELRQMSLRRENKIATFEFTIKGLADFRDAIIRWCDGATDFRISPQGSRKAKHLITRKELGSKDLASGELWFWSPRMSP